MTNPDRDVTVTDNSSDVARKDADRHLAVQGMDVKQSQEKNEDITPVAVPNNATTKQLPVCLLKGKTCILKLKAISQLDIDVWCNKVMNYHTHNPPKPVEPPPENEDDTGYSLRKCKPKGDRIRIALHTKNSVDYTPMLDSEGEDEDDAPPKKQGKI